MRPSAALFCALSLAACATPPAGPPPGPVAVGASFDPQALAWSRASGRNVIAGTVALQSAAGRYTCAGGSVALTPESAYTRQRIEVLYGSAVRAVLPVETVRARSIVNDAPELGGYVRTAACDADGGFRFTDLPDGAWFVVARARPATGEGEALALVQRVEARGGRQVSVTLD